MGVNSLLHIMSTKDLSSENMGQVRPWIALFFPTETKRLSGLDLLRYHSALTAMMDSLERCHSPKCAENTRKSLIQRLEDWIDSDDEEASMTLLYGALGSGKTALAQTLSELYRKYGRLAGTMFFSRTSAPERSDGNRLIPTLVLQILELFPESRKDLEKWINSNKEVFAKAPSNQMDNLFVATVSLSRQQLSAKIKKRLSKLTGSTTRGWLIVIDGLDECESHTIQEDLLRVIAKALPQLSFPFRFLITSRPADHIQRVFDRDPAFRSTRKQKINLGDEKDTEEDIRTVLKLGFSKIRTDHPLADHLDQSWPSAEDFEALVRNSSTHFIYATTVLSYISSKDHRPEERLAAILHARSGSVPAPPPTSDSPLQELYALYTQVFNGVAEAHRQTVTQIFGVLRLSSTLNEHTVLRDAATVVMLEKILNKKPGDIGLILNPLSSVITTPSNRQEYVEVVHASIFEYLLDRSHAGAFYLERSIAHETLALHHLDVMKSSEPGEFCELLTK